MTVKIFAIRETLLSKLESWIANTSLGSSIAPPNDYVSSATMPGYRFLVQSATLDDSGVFASSNYIAFAGHGSLGMMVNRIQEHGRIAEDNYSIKGLRIWGDQSTVRQLQFWDFDYTDTLSNTSITTTLFSKTVGPGGDNYFATRANGNMTWNVDWDTTTFLAAVNASKIDGNSAPLKALLNGEQFEYNGGNFRDFFSGYAKDDTLTGNGGNDEFSGNGGDDTINGDAGDDVLRGGDGDDTLRGGSGTNSIDGSEGNDRFESQGGGTNSVNGGAGNDVYVLGEGADTITDGVGYDTLKFSSYVFGDWDRGQWLGELITNDHWQPTDFDQLIGSDSNDVLHMNNNWTSNKFVLRGGAGNDSLVGAARSDRLYGDNGNDFLSGNEGNDVISGGRGADSAYFNDHYGNLSKGWNINLAAGTARTTSQSGSGLNLRLKIEEDKLSSIEHVVASAGDDVITGNAANNAVDGLAGTDTFSFADHFGDSSKGWVIDMINKVAKTSANVLVGGVLTLRTETDKLNGIENIIASSGNDKIKSNGLGVVDGGAGKDTLVLAATAPSAFTTSGVAAADDDVSFLTGKAVRSVSFNDGLGIEYLLQTQKFSRIERVDTGTGNDKVVGSSKAETAYLGDGADLAAMGNGKDQISGGMGEDSLDGGAGSDTFLYFSKDEGTDIIVNFEVIDFIAFKGSAFGGLSTGALDASRFWSSATGVAHDADDRFIFNTSDDSLSYDSNGNAAGGAFKLADMTNDYNILTAKDILIV